MNFCEEMDSDLAGWCDRLGMEMENLLEIKRNIEGVLGETYLANQKEINFYVSLSGCPYSELN